MEQLEACCDGKVAVAGSREWFQRGACIVAVLFILGFLQDLRYAPANSSSWGLQLKSQPIRDQKKNLRQDSRRQRQRQSTDQHTASLVAVGKSSSLDLQLTPSSANSSIRPVKPLPLPIPLLRWRDPIPLHRCGSVDDNVYFHQRSLSGVPSLAVRQELTHVLMTTLLTDHIHWRTVFRFVLSFNRATAQNRNSTALFIFANDNIVKQLRFKLSRLQNTFVVGFPKNRELTKQRFWISSLRFLLYRLLLQQLPQAQVIMVSDIFDVYFQEDDPLRYFEEKTVASGKGLTIALEDCKFGLRGQPDNGLNERWIRECFSDFPGPLHGKFVSCSGTTVGLRPTMAKYLQLMDDVLRRDDVHSFKCSRIGFDQGVHNYLVHLSGVLFNNTIEEHPTLGRIVTGNGILHWRFDEGRGGALVNALGEPYVIVHQPNRCSTPQGHNLKFWSMLANESGNASIDLRGGQNGSGNSTHPPQDGNRSDTHLTTSTERREKPVRLEPRGPWFVASGKQCRAVQWPQHLENLLVPRKPEKL
jgi:hypothetical protein